MEPCLRVEDGGSSFGITEDEELEDSESRMHITLLFE